MRSQAKWEYMKAIYQRYHGATRKKKKDILDEFCKTYKCHRKHVIRLLSGPPPPKNVHGDANGTVRHFANPRSKKWKTERSPKKSRRPIVLLEVLHSAENFIDIKIPMKDFLCLNEVFPD